MGRRLGILAVLALLAGCSSSNEAIKRGVGSECGASLACTEKGQTCLTQFKGGYCGVANCAHDTDCPTGSACVTETDGVNYCFLICNLKTDCNPRRSVANESDCVSSIPFVDGANNRKVCRPPLGGSSTTDGGPG